ncbi:MAG: Sensory box histidine kinase [Labilithrix sp.]|nr:Sensory box histidine kinase [Labilithrix sp.]
MVAVAGTLGASLLLTHGLATTEETFQVVFESAAVGIARVSLDGHWLEMNQAYCDILGYPRREVDALTFQDVTHPDDLERDLEHAARLLRGEIRQYAIEKRYIRKDGATIWVELVASLVRAASGKPSYFVASVIDISARKAAEQARDEARRFAEDLAFVSPAFLYVYDLETSRTVYASREIGEMLGRRLDAIQALKVDELTRLIHPDDLPKAAAQVECVRALADGEVCEKELRVMHADGSWRWLLARNAVFRRDASGAVVQSVGSALDITDLARSEQAAREARALVDALYAQAPIGLAYFDRALRCVLVNQAVAELVGTSAEAPIGRFVADALPGPLGQVMADDMRRVIATGASTTGLTLQVATDSTPAQLRDLIVSYYPVRVSGADVVGLGCIIEDVTQRRRAEAELEGLVVDLREAVRAREDFLSIASHELRTPLTTLTLGTELLLRLLRTESMPPREQLSGKVEQLQKQAQRLERLIGTLLDVARIVQSRVQLFPEELDVACVVREQVERLRDNAAASGSCVTVAAQAPILGQFDRTRLEQIVDNLVSNAIKFGAGKPISVTLEASEEKIQLSVRDQGLGIAKEDRARIFERFERAVSGRHYGGLGLGLWVTRQIVEAMGGTIFVTGEYGQGSTFTVEWPRQAS